MLKLSSETITISIARDHLGQRLCVGDYVLFYLSIHGGKHRMESGTIETLYTNSCVIAYEDAAGGTRHAIRDCSNVCSVWMYMAENTEWNQAQSNRCMKQSASLNIKTLMVQHVLQSENAAMLYWRRCNELEACCNGWIYCIYNTLYLHATCCTISRHLCWQIACSVCTACSASMENEEI